MRRYCQRNGHPFRTQQAVKQAVKTIGRGSLTEMEKPDVWQRLMDEQMRLFGFGLSEYVREKDELMLKDELVLNGRRDRDGRPKAWVQEDNG